MTGRSHGPPIYFRRAANGSKQHFPPSFYIVCTSDQGLKSMVYCFVLKALADVLLAWFSGRMLGGPGSIPGRCKLLYCRPQFIFIYIKLFILYILLVHHTSTDVISVPLARVRGAKGATRGGRARTTVIAFILGYII